MPACITGHMTSWVCLLGDLLLVGVWLLARGVCMKADPPPEILTTGRQYTSYCNAYLFLYDDKRLYEILSLDTKKMLFTILW